MLTRQVPVPEHPPDQPAKVEPGRETAVRVTVEPSGNCAVQSPPQSIPAGSEVTAPCPSPASWMPTAAEFRSKTATRDRSASSFKEHALVPAHAPPQVVKVAPCCATGTTVTAVPRAYRYSPAAQVVQVSGVG